MKLDEKTKLFEFAAVGFFISLIFFPLYFGSVIERGGQNSTDQLGSLRPRTHDSQLNEPESRSRPYNDANGTKIIPNGFCYRLETVGECAARVVQSTVSTFYIMLVVIGGIQALAAFLTWYLLRRQTTILRQQSSTIERLERPLVLPIAPLGGVVGYRDSRNKSVFPIIDIDFRNHGRSPALVDCWHVGLFVSDRPPIRKKLQDCYFNTWTYGAPFETSTFISTGVDLVPYMKIFPSTASLAPGERFGWLDLKELNLNEAQKVNVERGNQKVWLDGVLFYTDICRIDRETHFRWVYEYKLDLLV